MATRFFKIFLINFFKSDPHLTCFNESPSKIMKNAFHFLIKVFSVLKFLNFCPDFFDHVRKGLDKKANFNLKICDFTDWTINIKIHILPNISRNKDNQTMKFAQ